MKKEQVEIKSYKTVYIANDGTKFDSEDECIKYEKTCEGVIKSQVNKCLVKKGVYADKFKDLSGTDVSYDDYFDIYEPKSLEDIDALNKYLIFHSIGAVADASHIGKRIAIDRYDYDLWFVGTREDMLKRFNEALDYLFNDEEKKDAVQG